MFVSIIIPVYNAQAHIAECLNSCLEQNLDISDFEIICINDGSTDNSLSILQSFASRYTNIVVLDQPNKGVSAARNRGLQQAQAEYIWFVDSDDMIKPNCLQLLKKEVQDGSDIISLGSYSFIEKLSEIEQRKLYEGQLVSNKTYWGYVTVHLYKRCVLMQNNIAFHTEITYGEDELFFIEIWENSSQRRMLDDVFYLYRQHESSAMNQLHHKKNQVRRLDSVMRSIILLKAGLEAGKYTKNETIQLLTGRYELLPYLFAVMDRETGKYYLDVIRNNDIFERSFIAKYGFPAPCKVYIIYLKEKMVDWVNSFIKTILPDRVIHALKQFLNRNR